MIEILGVLTLAAILSVAGYAGYTKILGRGSAISADRAAGELNSSSQAFLGARGTFDPKASAEEFLTVLQTPVDALSVKAGFGDFPRVNPHWALVAADRDTEGARITVHYDAAQKRPVWGSANAGEGWRLILDRNKTEPAPADWTAYVDAKAKISQTGARHTAWLWDTDDTPATPNLNKGSNAVDLPYGSVTGADLSVSGPSKVTTAGVPVYWTGVSSISGTLTISIDGEKMTRINASSVESVHKVFAPGDRGSHTITLTRSEGGSITRTFDVDIPDTLAIAITGPDSITSPNDATWTATCSELAEDIVIKVEDVVVKDRKKPTVSATHPAWPPGTGMGSPKQIKVTASAMNGSGAVNASKIVTIEIPKASIVWRIEPDTGPRVEINGANHYIVSATADLGGYTGTFTFDATLSSTAWVMTYGVNDGSYANPPPATKVPVALSATKVRDADHPNKIKFVIDDGGLDEKARLTGVFTATANLDLPGVSVTSDTELFNVAVPRLKGDFRWTVSVSSTTGTLDPAKITEYRLNIFSADGSSVVGSPFKKEGGVLTRDFDVTLPIGQFNVWGEARNANGLIPGAPGAGNSSTDPIHFEVLK